MKEKEDDKQSVVTSMLEKKGVKDMMNKKLLLAGDHGRLATSLFETIHKPNQAHGDGVLWLQRAARGLSFSRFCSRPALSVRRFSDSILSILGILATVGALLLPATEGLAAEEPGALRPGTPDFVKLPFDPLPTASAESVRAVEGLLGRLLPKYVGRFAFETIPADQGRDVFELESVGDRVVIRGNNGLAMSTGLNWYLKHYGHCQVSWYGNQLNLPDPLPPVKDKVRQVSWARGRYFLNYCCFGYSLPWWDWAQWEKLIDWMALNGVNMPLSVTGQEAVWQAVCRKLGMDDRETTEFLAGPPYLPFQWMGCLDGYGGPLPQSWIPRHEELAKKILARQRQLGMTPVLQGFTGHVPAAVAKRFPEARLHKINWSTWNTQLLDPLDPLFTRIAKMFLEEQTLRFGTDHLYASDTFVEMTPPNGDLKYLAELGRALYDGMAKTDPQAVWVLQSWPFKYAASFWTQPRMKAFFDATPDDRMVVLDLFCEETPMWSRTKAFYGKPWLWCNVQNFGRNIYLGGDLERNNQGLQAARRDPTRGRLAGLGFVNEGLCYNPIAYDLMFELAWRDEPVDMKAWVADYALQRYGRPNAHAQRAWSLLLQNVYTKPIGSHVPNRYNPGIANVPWVDNRRLSETVSPRNVALAEAWHELVQASDELGAVDTFRFDLVNVGRQTLANRGSFFQCKAIGAWQTKDVEELKKSARQFIEVIGDVDDLVGTREEFLLGCWLEDAKRWGQTDAERATLQWNARNQITLWGEWNSSLRGYACKQWSGMLSGFYAVSWRMFFDRLEAALAAGKSFDASGCDKDIRQREAAWTRQTQSYPVTPQGDSVKISRRLWAKYGEDLLRPEEPSLTTGKPATCSHELPGHTASLANDGDASDSASCWATDTKFGSTAWWQVDLEKPTTVGRVVVVGYYAAARSYGFTVETSQDGRQWEMVADRRQNQEPSTAAGYTCKFPPRAVRYLRVTQTQNSANTGRHLVEVMAFEK